MPSATGAMREFLEQLTEEEFYSFCRDYRAIVRYRRTADRYDPYEIDQALSKYRPGVTATSGEQRILAIREWRGEMINAVLESKHRDPPCFERLCKAAGVPTDDEKRLELAEESNAIAAKAVEIAERAESKSKKADLKSWIALLTAIFGLVGGLLKAIL